MTEHILGGNLMTCSLYHTQCAIKDAPLGEKNEESLLFPRETLVKFPSEQDSLGETSQLAKNK